MVRSVLAWRTPTAFLADLEPSGGGSQHRLVEISLADGSVQTVSTYDERMLSRVNSIGLAAGPAAAAGPTDAGVLRGPWPPWARITFAVIAGLGLLRLSWEFRRRRRHAMDDRRPGPPVG
jgi:hypothetical protein